MNDIEKAEMLLAKAMFPFLPWQSLNQDDEWRDVQINNTFERLVEHFACYGTARFDPLFAWPYPPENREGVQVWKLVEYSDPQRQTWIFCRDKDDTSNIRFSYNILQVVAADPRKLQEPPPNV